MILLLILFFSSFSDCSDTGKSSKLEDAHNNKTNVGIDKIFTSCISDIMGTVNIGRPKDPHNKDTSVELDEFLVSHIENFFVCGVDLGKIEALTDGEFEVVFFLSSELRDIYSKNTEVLSSEDLKRNFAMLSQIINKKWDRVLEEKTKNLLKSNSDIDTEKFLSYKKNQSFIVLARFLSENKDKVLHINNNIVVWNSLLIDVMLKMTYQKVEKFDNKTQRAFNFQNTKLSGQQALSTNKPQRDCDLQNTRLLTRQTLSALLGEKEEEPKPFVLKNDLLTDTSTQELSKTNQEILDEDRYEKQKENAKLKEKKEARRKKEEERQQAEKKKILGKKLEQRTAQLETKSRNSLIRAQEAKKEKAISSEEKESHLQVPQEKYSVATEKLNNDLQENDDLEEAVSAETMRKEQDSSSLVVVTETIEVASQEKFTYSACSKANSTIIKPNDSKEKNKREFEQIKSNKVFVNRNGCRYMWDPYPCNLLRIKDRR